MKIPKKIIKKLRFGSVVMTTLGKGVIIGRDDYVEGRLRPNRWFIVLAKVWSRVSSIDKEDVKKIIRY